MKIFKSINFYDTPYDENYAYILSRFKTCDFKNPKHTAIIAKVLKTLPHIDVSNFHLINSDDPYVENSGCKFEKDSVDDMCYIRLSYITMNSNEHDLMFVLIHELRHIEQFTTGKLDFTEDYLYWENKPIGTKFWISYMVEAKDYPLLPHEYDANVFTLNHPLIKENWHRLELNKDILEIVLPEMKKRETLENTLEVS